MFYILQDFKSIYQAVIAQLEAKIDPFDLNVFTPYINSNVKITAFQTQVSVLFILFAYNWCLTVCLDILLWFWFLKIKSKYIFKHGNIFFVRSYEMVLAMLSIEYS